MYGSERVPRYPSRQSKIKIERGGMKAPLKKVEEKKSESKPLYREARKESKSEKDLFTVQLGSFEKKEHAEELLQKLQKKGYPVFLEKADLGKKGTWYRVKAGEFISKQEAEKLRKRLENEEGLKEGLVVSL